MIIKQDRFSASGAIHAGVEQLQELQDKLIEASNTQERQIEELREWQQGMDKYAEDTIDGSSIDPEAELPLTAIDRLIADLTKKVEALEGNINGILEGLIKVFTPEQFAKIGMDTDTSGKPETYIEGGKVICLYCHQPIGDDPAPPQEEIDGD